MEYPLVSLNISCPGYVSSKILTAASLMVTGKCCRHSLGAVQALLSCSQNTDQVRTVTGKYLSQTQCSHVFKRLVFGIVTCQTLFCCFLHYTNVVFHKGLLITFYVQSCNRVTRMKQNDEVLRKCWGTTFTLCIVTGWFKCS